MCEEVLLNRQGAKDPVPSTGATPVKQEKKRGLTGQAGRARRSLDGFVLILKEKFRIRTDQALPGGSPLFGDSHWTKKSLCLGGLCENVSLRPLGRLGFTG